MFLVSRDAEWRNRCWGASRCLKILLIEDDQENADYVANGLHEEGHLVAQVASGAEGLICAVGNGFDLLIVDRMIPGLDGLNLVKSLRAAGHHTPVLFLTALGGVEDRVSGLNAGGDDYLVKPFAFSELVARVAALGRRPRTTAAETRLHVLDLELDLLSRTMLREHVWDIHFDPRTNVVETHISRLRTKVDKGFEAELIHTVRGAGYCVRSPT